MSERTEAMLSDNAGRDLDVTCTMGFDADHRLVAYKVDSLSNMGAYNSQFGQNIQSALFSRVLTGTYDVQTVHFRNRGIYTNTIQVDAYRGAGRPEAIYALERAMDFAARSWASTRRSCAARTSSGRTSSPTRPPAASFTMSATSRLFWTAGQAGGRRRGLRRAAASSEAAGKLRGLGICYYIESILGAPDETATIEITETGAKVYVGTQSNGQGHETVYAQLPA
jgi:carbon-monoxide dehydrogenase large subunit